MKTAHKAADFTRFICSTCTETRDSVMFGFCVWFGRENKITACRSQWLSPHSPDEEIEDSGHGDADEDVQGPLNHGTVHIQPGDHTSRTGTLHAVLRAVRRSIIGRGGSGCRGADDGLFGHIVLGEHEKPTKRNENQHQSP